MQDEPAPAEPPSAEPPAAEPPVEDAPLTDDGSTPIPAPEEDLTAPMPEADAPIDQTQPGQPQIIDTPDSFRAVDPNFSQNQIDDLLRQGATAGA